MPLFSFLILYFFISREKNTTIKNALVYLSSCVVALVSIVIFFNPFKQAELPVIFDFLKNPGFSPLGNSLDAIFFLGFAAVLAASSIFSKTNKSQTERILSFGSFTLSLSAIGFLIFSLVKTKDAFILPPFNLSWYGAVETLKQPLTALFGVGVDNYASMFTRVKDTAYNASNMWQISAFNASRSTFLHIPTELGMFGAVAFGLLILQIIRHGFAIQKQHGNKYVFLPILFFLIITLLFPPSLTVFFLLFLILSGVGTHEKHEETAAFTLDTGKILPLYGSFIIISLLFIGALGYLGGRSYAAEVYFKRSLDGFAKNNAKYVYENMRMAVITNPFIERFRSNFSQTNLLLANNIAAKAADPANASADKQTDSTNTNTLSDQDRQTISQALQAAIEEAKAAVTLNPQKAVNWENLANIYRNIMNVAQGADSWTISAYQRAIILDPQNPSHRVNLGGIMLSFKNYDEAAKLFEQAIAIKPDWPNAYYNLGWAAYQKKDYQKAAQAMQSTVSLLDPKKDEADYKKAMADLEEFKKMLPEEEATEAATTPSKLSVPTPSSLEIEPKIKLPNEASPEAK